MKLLIVVAFITVDVLLVLSLSACGPSEPHMKLMTDEEVFDASEKCLKMGMNTRVREGIWFDGRAGVISVYCVPPS